MTISGVYCIRNRTTLRVYVGSTSNLVGRCRQHRNLLRKGKHHSIHLQNDWNNLGENCFEFIILQLINSTDRSILAKSEQFWIDLYYSFDPGFGYNILPNALSRIGSTNSDASKERVKETMNKIYLKDPKLREQLLAMNKKVMTDPITRATAIATLVSESKTETGRKRRSDLAKEMWKDGRLAASSEEMRRRYLCSKRAKAKVPS